MSYILDALKKSEEERNAARPGAGDGPREAAIVIKHNWPAIGALLLLLNALLAVLLVWWNAEPQVDPSAGETATTADVEQLKTETKPEPDRAPASTVAAYRPTGERGADLGAQVPPRRERIGATAKAAPAVTTAETSGSTAPDANKVLFLRQLPVSFQQSLPELAVNIHVYTPAGDNSILYINNRQYRPGEYVQQGLRVESIAPDGAVLSYQDRYFKLPRPR